MTDADTIGLFWARSETAITELGKKYDRLARSVAMNILRDRLDTEECMNDSYLGMWNSLPPEKPQVLPAFFTAITRNLALKLYRWNIYDSKVSYPYEDPALSDPNNTNTQTITTDVRGYTVRMEIPEIWRNNGHTYHDRIREADETLDPLRLNLSIDMHTNLLMDSDGNWSPERLDGSMITLESFGSILATVISTGTNTNGLSYLIITDESLDPYTIGKDYSIAFAHNAQILFTFCISTYPEDGEHDFEEIVLPIIESVTAEEANEFIVFWLPLMEQNPYNIISFQSDIFTDLAKLTVTPTPDTVIRVFMAWQASVEFVEIETQELSAPEREGFTVIEWGGIQVITVE